MIYTEMTIFHIARAILIAFIACTFALVRPNVTGTKKNNKNKDQLSEVCCAILQYLRPQVPFGFFWRADWS